MKRYGRWVLFDADDTLIGTVLNGKIVGTTVVYDHVVNLATTAMVELGFDEKEARAKLFEIDSARCRTLGFARKERFPRSLRIAYHELCRIHGRHHDREIAIKIERLGFTVFDFPAMPLPGALDVLSAVEREYEVAVVTKGNDAQQRHKIVEAGLPIHRSRIITMTSKSVDEWRSRVLAPLGIDTAVARESWAVGDSARSDVNPTLKLGFNAIHISVGVFAFEQIEYAKVVKGAAFHVVSNIREALDHIPLDSCKG